MPASQAGRRRFKSGRPLLQHEHDVPCAPQLNVPPAVKKPPGKIIPIAHFVPPAVAPPTSARGRWNRIGFRGKKRKVSQRQVQSPMAKVQKSSGPKNARSEECGVHDSFIQIPNPRSPKAPNPDP